MFRIADESAIDGAKVTRINKITPQIELQAEVGRHKCTECYDDAQHNLACTAKEESIEYVGNIFVNSSSEMPSIGIRIF